MTRPMPEPTEADSTMSTHRVQIIENARLTDIRPGDHITRVSTKEVGSVVVTVRREGIAHHRDDWGVWHTEDDKWIVGGGADGEDEDITITIRRPVQELPTTSCAAIVANDGHEYITATFQGVTYYAREAVLNMNGSWRGAWRGDGRVKYNMYPSQITRDCWKVDDQ